MAARFADHPEAVAETARWPSGCASTSRSDLGYRYPGAEDADGDAQAARSCARRACDERYATRGRERVRDARRGRRLEEELRIIDTLGLAGFFLLHHDMLELAREVARRGARRRTRPGRCCRPGAGAARGSPRSSAT